MVIDKNISELEENLGQQLLDLRLRQNINQRELAKRATVSSLIKVLRTLGRAEWLTSLAPVVSISPMQMLKNKHVRQRASKGKSSHV